MKDTNNGKIAPKAVNERLSKDVHAILSVCIQHFDESLRLSKEECFDVDAIVSGRAHGSSTGYGRRVAPAAYARPAARDSVESSVLSRPQKGYFIPNAYASHVAFA